MERPHDNNQRSVSWGELADLEQRFDAQAAARGIVFPDDDTRAQALFDFNDQYINGNDDPQINTP